MSLLKWTKALEVGIEAIDVQHGWLLDAMNELSHYILRGQDKQGFIDAAEKINDYVVYHFEAEERLMQKSNFQGMEAHVREHKKFAAAAASFTAENFKSSPQKSHELLIYLQGWLVDHIMGTDMIFATHYRATMKK